MTRPENYVPSHKNLGRLLLLFIAIAFISCTTLVPEEKITSSFSDQRGNLVWPSEGVIIEHYGTVVNPVYGTQVQNPGILISTNSSTEVKSVFDGEVLEVFTMPEFGRVMTISHGDYTTLYGNLSSFQVSEGMHVRAGQLIGNSGTEDQPKRNAVFFALFRDGVEANPELWLERR